MVGISFIVNDELQKIIKLLNDSWFSAILGWIGGMAKLCLQLHAVKDGDIKHLARPRYFITVSFIAAIVGFLIWIWLDGFFKFEYKIIITCICGFASVQILTSLRRLEKTIITKILDKICGFKEYKQDD